MELLIDKFQLFAFEFIAPFEHPEAIFSKIGALIFSIAGNLEVHFAGSALKIVERHRDHLVVDAIPELSLGQPDVFVLVR